MVVTKKGTLLKRRDIFKTYRPRLFVLDPPLLHYYLSPQDVGKKRSYKIKILTNKMIYKEVLSIMLDEWHANIMTFQLEAKTRREGRHEGPTSDKRSDIDKLSDGDSDDRRSLMCAFSVSPEGQRQRSASKGPRSRREHKNYKPHYIVKSVSGTFRPQRRPLLSIPSPISNNHT